MNLKSISKAIAFSSIALSITLFSGCGSDSTSDEESSSSVADSSSSNEELSSSTDGSSVLLPKRAEPVATSKNPEQPVVLDSWKEGGKNWYVIDAGYIDNSLVMETDHEGYQGLVEMKFTTTQSVKESMSKSRTQNVSENINVSNSLGATVGIEVAIKNTLKASGNVYVLKVEDALETSLKANAQTSVSVSASQGRTVQTSESLAMGLETTITNSLSYTLDKNTPIGYYRYAWYATNDVYFIISTSLDNRELLSWDVISCTRPTLTKVFEYSPDNKFDNSPKEGTEIVFAEDFYKNLKIPTKEVSQSSSSSAVESSNSETSSSSVAESSSSAIKNKNETKEFINNDSYTFNKGFPATVEIYAFGAGGGGQGGHTYKTNLGATINPGTGGAGGGGAAAYVVFDITEAISFDISIGKGGIGGAARDVPWGNGVRGYEGIKGGDSKITWGNRTLTAGGGNGGSGTDDNLKGGSGGVSLLSDNIANSLLKNGSNGSDGSLNGSSKSEGGKGAILNIGSYSSGSGAGNGGFGGNTKDQNGENGGDGKVIIVVTYPE